MMRAKATTADRFALLGEAAKAVYRRLLVDWLTEGVGVWTRRDVHQLLKGAKRFRHLTGLLDPLSELIEAGLLANIEPEPRRGFRSPRYALARPYLAPSVKRPPRNAHTIPVPPLPTATPEEHGAAIRAVPQPLRATLTRDREIAWRAERLGEQVRRTGRLAPFRLREGTSVAGHCHACGDPCLEALRLVMASTR
jgi:hypothetical protein